MGSYVAIHKLWFCQYHMLGKFKQKMMILVPHFCSCLCASDIGIYSTIIVFLVMFHRICSEGCLHNTGAWSSGCYTSARRQCFLHAWVFRFLFKFCFHSIHFNFITALEQLYRYLPISDQKRQNTCFIHQADWQHYGVCNMLSTVDSIIVFAICYLLLIAL